MKSLQNVFNTENSCFKTADLCARLNLTGKPEVSSLSL